MSASFRQTAWLSTKPIFFRCLLESMLGQAGSVWGTVVKLALCWQLQPFFLRQILLLSRLAHPPLQNKPAPSTTATIPRRCFVVEPLWISLPVPSMLPSDSLQHVEQPVLSLDLVSTVLSVLLHLKCGVSSLEMFQCL